MTSAVAKTSAALPLAGRHLVQHHAFYYPPEVTTADVLEVDFDAHVIGPDGLYVIAYPATNEPGIFGSAWGGLRRFCTMPITGLRIFEGDEWSPLNKGHRDMQVIGRVLNVYRRTAD